MPITPPIVLDLTGFTAIAYTRVSTEDQAAERRTSLADQRAAIATLAAKLGVTVGHVFEDAGASGAWDDRPQFASLIASCEASPRKQSPASVLVLNDSRWGRFEDSEDGTYFRRRIGRIGWRVQFTENDDVQDDFLRPLLRTLAQTQSSLYRSNLKTNVKRGCKGQAELGYWQAKAPFGYARRVVFPPGRERTLGHHVPKATDEKLILVPIPEEAAIVRDIFDRYAQGGESVNSLLEWLSVAMPSKPWVRASVLRILSNPVYTGDVVWGRVGVSPTARTTRSVAEWYGKDNAHEAIVSRALFAEAQARLAINKAGTRSVRTDWVLTGLVKCSCGRGITGFGPVGRKGAFPVYACASRGEHKHRRCAYTGLVTKELLEQAAIDLLVKEIGSGVHRRALEAAADRLLEQWAAARRRPQTIAREIAAVRQKQSRLVAAIESGAITSTDAGDRMRALRAELDGLLVEESRASATTGDFAKWKEDIVTQASDFRARVTELTGPTLREAIRCWIQRAEFNLKTRELTMEIRRVPAMSLGTTFTASASPRCGDLERRASLPGQFPAQDKRRDATITRVVIVGRRKIA